MSNAASRLESGELGADLLEGVHEIRQERTDQRVGKAYAFGMLMGAATVALAGGVIAMAKADDAKAQGGDSALQCVTRELSKPNAPRDPMKGPGTGLLTGAPSLEMQEIIARCRAEIGQD